MILNIFSIIPLVCKQPYLCKCGTWEIPFIAHASFSTACRKRKPWCNGVRIWDQSRTGIDSEADWHLKFQLVLCWNVSHEQSGMEWHWSSANEYLNFGFQWLLWLLGGYSNICYCRFEALFSCVLVTQWSIFLCAFVKVNACNRGQQRDRWKISQISFSLLPRVSSRGWFDVPNPTLLPCQSTILVHVSDTCGYLIKFAL